MLTAILIALSMLGNNPQWSDDDYRCAIADQHPDATNQAIAIVRSMDCIVYEDLTAECDQ